MNKAVDPNRKHCSITEELIHHHSSNPKYDFIRHWAIPSNERVLTTTANVQSTQRYTHTFIHTYTRF